MLLPLKDDNPLTHVRFQFVTVALIALNVLAFFWTASLSEAETIRAMTAFGFIPAVVLGPATLDPSVAVIPAPLTILTSMFLHGSFMHLAGNMLFLWVLGDNVEDATGHGFFLAFYLLCGAAAAVAHGAADPRSTIPTIGASGAVSGVIGAYLVLHPRAQILTLVLRYAVRLPAVVVLGLWAAFQVWNATQGGGGTGGGVAWWAHVGGFVVGALLIVPMRRKGVPLFNGVFRAPGTPPPPSPRGLRLMPRGRNGGGRRGRGSVPDSGGSPGRDRD